MAAPLTAQGVNITFRGQVLGKYVGIDGEFRAPPKTFNAIDGELDGQGRVIPVLEPAVLEESTGLEALCTGVDRTLVGRTGALAVTGTGWSWGFNAYLEDFKVTGRVGEYLRVTFLLRRCSAT